MTLFEYNENLTAEALEAKEAIVSEIYNQSKDVRSISKVAASRDETFPCGDIEDFIKCVGEVIELDQEDAENKIGFVPMWNEEEIMQDSEYEQYDMSGVVAYSISRRGPASTAGGNTPFSKERRMLKPVLKNIIKNSAENPNQVKLIYSQAFDNMICFRVCAKTNKRAEELSRWFEDLMTKNRLYFALKGFSHYYFDGFEYGDSIRAGHQMYQNRPHYYYVRTEKITSVDEYAINKIAIRLVKQTK